ncbi:MAG: LysM peptidoglycan-binding domain-containing protein, partial [Actinomycetota bacterium]
TKDLLNANKASIRTLLLPGKQVCLSKGATMPTPTTTAAPVTTIAAPVKAATVCTKKYTIVKGDAWSTIAKRAGITTAQLLAVNRASATTLLLPGRSICLPANAATPTVPAPTTTAARPSSGIVKTRAYSSAEVQKIIRDVWPDELEEWALKQAWKESNWLNNEYNSCCYGLFQINFNAHKDWLKGYGITNPSQLLDPLVNTQMAVIVYRRMGGPGPWGN